MENARLAPTKAADIAIYKRGGARNRVAGVRASTSNPTRMWTQASDRKFDKDRKIPEPPSHVAKGRALVTDSYRRLPHTIYTRQLCADRKLSIRRDPITHLTISQLRTQSRFGRRHLHALFFSFPCSGLRLRNHAHGTYSGAFFEGESCGPDRAEEVMGGGGGDTEPPAER